MNYDMLREAITSCTGYDLIHILDDDIDEYALIDPYGDQDGDAFECLEDVYDYVSDNEQVDEYLNELIHGGNN